MTAGQHAAETPISGGSQKPEVTMRAIVQEAYGSADVLHLAQIPTPTIAENEVLVRVHAAGLDRGTWHVTRGLPYALRLAFGVRAPKNPVPGMDLAGTVTAVGAAVTRFAVGDEVFGVGKGSFAEYATARESQLALKPANISFKQASVVPVSACTALQALRAAGRIAPGQKVLILGASGGVGSYAVQLAKAAGAEVTGVCSAAKMDLVRSLGADHVLDYTTQDFADGTKHYDLILDIAGNPTLARLRKALTPTGTAVITGGEEGGSWTGSIDRQFRALALSPFIGQRLTMVMGTQDVADLEYLAGLIDAGTLTPTVDRSYPLEQVPDAMRYFDAGKVLGKIAITIREAQGN
ncbi:NAD(P)-dependent alcohol dehydrogenase [Arthrobacter bambusae]|uniref:NADPH:quinone reductase-like Zn-dependent oxidoreductase n=1 Tax=Arthrobacter bambusae TaxID=1338426 RepID=A0AAW8DKZ9_9MICC|nr:NAD(P)-dependent alcohol dehydrogenase [Arthrobacter bambusae]MDP9907152.1 NADPH:quinone reductase-like Zn-dependent oxidoreductase [Arthrobacter bambusae]MDQ0131361.1 NADPH:quinone reductase-like Zn-dependent oxidoreductase [Arthrobacter bambusae]MDQ0182694.1 NADPH:quinone reductase-like Zn-dependent oxidoreductase [Arthrobacter bambusae]